MKDYSQFGEQAAILGAVAPFGSGTFLDLGAYDPFQFSNTRALFELGWSGVMVEPEPRAMLRLMAEYGKCDCITLIQAAAVYGDGMVDLHVTEDATATSIPEHYEKWKDACQYDGIITVPGITLAQLALRYGAFDFVNIDVEGASADLFVQMLELGWSPQCICVEHDDRMTELCVRASARGYKMVMANGTNAVFSL